MLLGQLVLLSERGLSQVLEESWVVVAELGNAVSETFTLLDRHESEVVALSALVVAGVMHVLVKASQHGKSLPSNIMHVQWIVLKFLNIYHHYVNKLTCCISKVFSFGTKLSNTAAFSY